MAKVYDVNGVPSSGFETGIVKVPHRLIAEMVNKTEYAESSVRMWFKDWVHSSFESAREAFEKSLDPDEVIAAFNKHLADKKVSRPPKEKSELDQKLQDLKNQVEKLRLEKKAARDEAKAAKESKSPETSVVS